MMLLFSYQSTIWGFSFALNLIINTESTLDSLNIPIQILDLFHLSLLAWKLTVPEMVSKHLYTPTFPEDRLEIITG